MKGTRRISTAGRTRAKSSIAGPVAVKAALPPISEKQFQAQVVKLAKLRQWTVWHCVMPKRSAAGLPDLILLRERTLWFELKSQRGRLRPEQIVFIERLREAGQEVYVLKPSDWDEVERLLA